MDILTWILSCGWYHMAAGPGLDVQGGTLTCWPLSGPWQFSWDHWPDCLPTVSPHHMDFSQNDSFFELVFQQTETAGSRQSLKAWTDTASLLSYILLGSCPDSRSGDKIPLSLIGKSVKGFVAIFNHTFFVSPYQGLWDSLPFPATAVLISSIQVLTHFAQTQLHCISLWASDFLPWASLALFCERPMGTHSALTNVQHECVGESIDGCSSLLSRQMALGYTLQDSPLSRIERPGAPIISRTTICLYIKPDLKC